MAPFYGWSSTASRLEPLRGGSLLFTTKFPEIPGEMVVQELKKPERYRKLRTDIIKKKTKKTIKSRYK